MGWLFAAPHADEVLLRARAREAGGPAGAGIPGRDELRELTRRHGCDLATAIAYERIRNEPTNAAFLARLERIPVATAPAVQRTRIAIVPTMYHRERPELGGDGALIAGIAARFGAEVLVVPVASLGGIDENAAIVARALAGMDATPTWLVTISKGSADAKRALVREPGLAQRIVGWINIAGMPGGSPFAEPRPGRPIAHALLQGWLRVRGASPGMLAEMGPSHAYSRAPLNLPPALQAINVVPMPLSFHLRKPVDRGAAWLARTGPNDGYVLLEDALILPGRVCPVWGADHYLRVPQFVELLYQLIAHACGAAS